MTRKKPFIPILVILFNLLFINLYPLPSAKISNKTPHSNQISIHSLETILHYNIEAQLLPQEKKLLGSTTIKWTNESKYDITSLRFHLYYNAFANEKTTLLKELKYFAKTEHELDNHQFGEIKINEIRIVEGEELTPKMKYISPDDQNSHDKTVMEVRLKESIKPDQSITIKIDYVLRIPEIIFKSGQVEDFFFMSQWYPQLGVLQSDGSWNCHQYHRDSGFFANFSNYEVAITLPEKFTIGATGNLEKKIKNADGTYTFLFMEKNIHDFAWTAYPEFREIAEKIKLNGNRENTNIVLLLSPDDQNKKTQYLESLKFAMKYYAENIFPYPLKKITLVTPPLKGIRSGNQAYPGLICISHLKPLPKLSMPIELKTIHEFGHQYWYGFIGTDEVREAWLDEGINAFFDMEIMEKFSQNSKNHINWIFLGVSIDKYYRWKYLSLPSPDPVNQYSWKFVNQASFRKNAIYKSGILLRSLKNHVGQKKMTDFFRFYAKRFKIKHPTTNDFINAFNQFFNADYSWAFDQFINDKLNLDQSVFFIESTKINRNPAKYRNEIICMRREGYFPVEILIKLKDGKEIKYYWNERENWKKFILENDSPLDYVILDPQNKIPLDKNRFNNSKSIKTSKKGLKNMAVKLGLYFQDLLSLVFL